MLNTRRATHYLVTAVALAMVVYHLVAAHTIIQQYIPHLNTHLGFSLILVFLAATSEAKGKKLLITWILTGLAVLCYAYIQIFWFEIQNRAYFNTTTDLTIGVILIALVCEATRRHFGILLPIICLTVVFYTLIGQSLPEPFYCHSFTLKDTIANLTVGLQGSGVIGELTSASMNYVYLFIVFGGVLQATGGTRFFLQLAQLVTTKLRGGPALMAVVSSALVGTVSGSVIANVAITGSFTIPLMKKVGYKPYQAGAVEAAASNGGQIMPPVMGIGAFIMAGITDIPYIQICAMAVLPAIIYYISLGAYVYFRAGDLDMAGVQVVENPEDKKELLKMAPAFIMPFATIIIVLLMDYSVMYAAFWTIVVSVITVLIRKKTRPSLGQFVEGFTKGSISGAGVGAVIACIAMLAASFTVSGLGIKISHGIEIWSGGYLVASLVIIWIICIIIGMGGVGFATYIVTSIFAVPALMKMGVPFAVSHFFIFFSTTFMGVTPPVAPAAIVAGKLAGAKYMKTAWETGRVAAAGLILPFVFVYAPVILLQPTGPFLGIPKLIGFVAALIAFQIAGIGFYIKRSDWLERGLAGVSALLLLLFVPINEYYLFVAGISIFIFITIKNIMKKPM